jgi:hypothetical protein
MTAVVTNPWQRVLLRLALGAAESQELVLRLFTNDVTPDEDTVRADLAEAEGFGYVPKVLSAGTWMLTEGPPWEAHYPEQTFLFNGPLGDVCGYYITQAKTGILAVAERFRMAYPIRSDGDHIQVAPVLRMPKPRKV